jgi:hypothetical protein
VEKQNKEQKDIKYVIWNENDNTYTLICSSCETKIIKLLELNDGDEWVTYKAFCQKCGNISFNKRLKGKVVFIPSDSGGNVIDIEYTEDLVGKLTILKVK